MVSEARKLRTETTKSPRCPTAAHGLRPCRRPSCRRTSRTSWRTCPARGGRSVEGGGERGRAQTCTSPRVGGASTITDQANPLKVPLNPRPHRRTGAETIIFGMLGKTRGAPRIRWLASAARPLPVLAHPTQPTAAVPKRRKQKRCFLRRRSTALKCRGRVGSSAKWWPSDGSGLGA